MQNWIADLNRYSLPQPPAWFLKALWDFDAALVIIPSRMMRKYLLARRRELSSSLAKIVENTKTADRLRVNASDGDMLADLNLVHVDSITSPVSNLAHGSWMRSAPGIFQQLRDRDTWALGGGDKYADKLEGAEADATHKQRRDLLDNIDHRARDAWRSLKARTGQRTRVGPGTSARSRAKIVQVGTL